ncbi:acyltransferase domain-containing protein, partial [Nocardia takedensis]|uniref:acyltransferase domain-containing protein n=1 Tax=Nocardia takedensis TaxID=259390 RepID=UPI0012F705BB
MDVVGVGAMLARRSVFEHRAVLIGSSREELVSRLQALIAGESSPGVVVGRAVEGKTVFVFPGQGAQFLGMGRELYERFPGFAVAFDEAAAACAAAPGSVVSGRSLSEVVWGVDAGELNSTVWAQPGLFAVEVGLCALLTEFGVSPDVVLGHSLGEITAAYVAGVVDLSGAAALVMGRARLMAGLPSGGAMVSVRAAADTVEPLLTGSGVDLAAVNGPEAVVISGPSEAVARVVGVLAGQGVKTTELAVSHAFHSALMEPVLEEFARVVAGVSVSAPRVAVVSNLDGRLSPEGYGAGDYWVRHLRETVRFGESMATVAGLGTGVRVLEVGPAALTSLVGEATGSSGVALMRRGRDDVAAVVQGLAAAFVAGVGVDWS